MDELLALVKRYENEPLKLTMSHEQWGNYYKWTFWGSFHIDNYIQVGTTVNTTEQIRNSVVGLMEYEAFNTREVEAVIAVQFVSTVAGFRQGRLMIYQGDMFSFYRSMATGVYDADVPYKSSADSMYIWIGWSTTLLWPGYACSPTIRVQAHATAPLNKSVQDGRSAAQAAPSNSGTMNSCYLLYPLDLGNQIDSYISSRHYGRETWALKSGTTPTNIYHTTAYTNWWW